MSEHPPRTGPEHEAPTPTATDLEHQLEHNTVPPTPEAPSGEITETQERLAAHTEGEGHSPEPTSAAASTPTTEAPKASSTPAVASTSTESGKMKLPGWMTGGFAIFGFFWMHIVWPAAKWTAENFSLKGSGGGGGAKKADHGHGH